MKHARYLAFCAALPLLLAACQPQPTATVPTMPNLPERIEAFQRDAQRPAEALNGAVDLGWFLRVGGRGHASVSASAAAPEVVGVPANFLRAFAAMARGGQEANQRAGMTVAPQPIRLLVVDRTVVAWCRPINRTPAPDGLERQLPCIGVTPYRFVTITVDVPNTPEDITAAERFASIVFATLGAVGLEPPPASRAQ